MQEDKTLQTEQTLNTEEKKVWIAPAFEVINIAGGVTGPDDGLGGAGS
jgi:hypothetical protein